MEFEFVYFKAAVQNFCHHAIFMKFVSRKEGVTSFEDYIDVMIQRLKNMQKKKKKKKRAKKDWLQQLVTAI